MTKVLLLSAAFGDGHRQVAHALRESFLKRNAMVYEIDCFQETNRVLAGLSQWTYESITRYVPTLYGASYNLTKNLRTNHWLWKLLALSSRKAMLHAVRSIQPDIVLQLFPDYAGASVPKVGRTPYWGIVITDFSAHSHWFHPNADAYFIANRQLASTMSRFASGESEVIDTGIPIRRQFRQLSDESPSHSPYVLLATGGRGLFPDFIRVTNLLLEHLPQHDVYVLCGRNKDMLHRVELEASNRPRLHGLSYVENVMDWFHHASLAVVKSGGITVSELLAAHCPMLFYRPQAGQEADNAAFLERMGTGFVIHNHKRLKNILQRPEFMAGIRNMKSKCASMARPLAAESIADHTLQRIAKRGPGHGRLGNE